MILGIMQPYFLPYIGYFSLIKHVDEFILFDTPQFIRHGWIERNRILKSNGEPMYIKVPLQKHHQKARINTLIINDELLWKDKIFAQLVHYKKKAPNYFKVIKLLEDIFNEDIESIAILNHKALTVICKYLEITTPIKLWSKMNLNIAQVNAPDEWALNICKAYEADAYYNPPGGRAFFNSEKYNQEGVLLKFLEIEADKYQQFSNDFIPFLSIIDVLMFCDKEQVDCMLNKANFVK